MDERLECGYVPANRHDPVAPTLAAHGLRLSYYGVMISNDFAVHLLYMYVFGSKQYITVSQLGHISVAGACGRRLEGRHLVYVTTYIHTEGVRPRPANGGGGIQGRRMHCMRRNTPISIPNVALRGIAN